MKTIFVVISMTLRDLWELLVKVSGNVPNVGMNFTFFAPKVANSWSNVLTKIVIPQPSILCRSAGKLNAQGMCGPSFSFRFLRSCPTSACGRDNIKPKPRRPISGRKTRVLPAKNIRNVRWCKNYRKITELFSIIFCCVDFIRLE